MPEENIRPGQSNEAGINDSGVQSSETSKELTERRRIMNELVGSTTASDAVLESARKLVEEWNPGLIRKTGDIPYLQVGHLPETIAERSIVDSTGNLIGRQQDTSAGLIARAGEELTIVTIPVKQSEELSAKTAEILRQAELAHERIGKDQQEIEQLKMETRALLAGLRAA